MRMYALCFFSLVAFSLHADIYDILNDAEMPQLEARFTLADLAQQDEWYHSPLPGAEALKIALQVILHDTHTLRCPMSIVGSRDELLNALNRHSAKLYLVSEGNDDLKPQWGEKVEHNWIFCLYLPHISDHLYFVVIDRRGARAPYVYGFN